MNGLFVVIISLLLPLMGGEPSAVEVALKPAPSDQRPVVSTFMAPIDQGSSWIEGKEKLSQRATTYFAYLYLGSSSTGDRLLTLDNPDDPEGKPTVCYLDLNSNKKIDENERLTLTCESYQGQDDLWVRKVPIMTGSRSKKKEVLINLLIRNQGSPEMNEKLLGVTAWSMRRGEAQVNGETYDIKLIDASIDGDFNDYNKQGFYESDNLIMTSKGSKAFFNSRPLCKKMIIGAQAYSVLVDKNGENLTFDPIEVSHGAIKTKAEGIEMRLFNASWGEMFAPADQELKLPEGKWLLVDFSRKKKNPAIVCSYRPTRSISFDITADKTNCVELDTTLRALISAKDGRSKKLLSLSLVTSQGVNFGSYHKSENQSYEYLEGVDFEITNSSGEVVLKDKFTFG